MSHRTALLLVGFLSTACQIIALRELAATLYGVELVYLLALGTWLLGTGIGALVASHVREAGRWTATAFATIAVVTGTSVVATRVAPAWVGGLTGAYLPASRQLAIVSLATMPMSIGLGLLFAMIARSDVGRGRSLAQAYADESVGAMAGGVVLTLAFVLGVRNLSVAIACVGLAIAASIDAMGRRENVSRIAVGMAAAVTLGLLISAGEIDRALAAWTRSNLVDVNDTPYGRVTIAKAGDQISVQRDNALWFDTEDSRAELLAHLTALAHAAPRDVVALGGALDGTCTALLEHRPRRVDALELDRRTFDLVRAALPRVSQSSPDAVHTTFGDPRRLLAARRNADLVVVAMPEPESGAANRFYTREFFVLARAALRPGGVLGLRLGLPENVLTPSAVARVASVERALRDAFPHVALLPAESSAIVLASDAPIDTTPETWAARFAQRRVRAALVSPALLRYVLRNDRRSTLIKSVADSAVPANSDALPVSYRYSTLAWLGRIATEPGESVRPLGPGAVAGDVVTGPIGSATWWALAVALVVMCVALRRWRRAHLVLRVATAAAAGMALDGILMLYFQVARGVLFEQVGLIVTGFMAGLVCGAAVVGRWPGERWSVVAALGLAGVGLGTAGIVHAGLGTMITILTLVAADGFCVAAMFAQAGHGEANIASDRVSTLYAGDVFGGAVAAFIVPTALVPVFGLEIAAAGAGAVALLCLAWL